MAEKRNVFISHVHADDHGLQKLKDLLKPQGVEIRDASIHTGKFNNAKDPNYIKTQILAPAIKDVYKRQVLNVRPETVSRWNKGRALPHASTEKQLLELEFVIDKLADIYEPHDARLWLFARQRLLDDQVPAELIQQGRVDEVLASVNQLLDGVQL